MNFTLLRKILAILLCLCQPTLAAIAFDAAGDGGNNGGSSSSYSLSPNPSAGGSATLAVVAIAGDIPAGADDITSVTWGGSGMTLAVKNTNVALNRNTYLYYILSPATGSQTVTVNAGSSHFILAGWASYTGVAVSGATIPDATTTNQSTIVAASLTTSITTTQDNSWAILVENHYSANNPATANTGSTRRTFDGAFGTWTLFDSGGPVTPAGSYSMTTDVSPANPIGHAVASFAPAAAGVAATICPSPFCGILQ